MILVCIVLDGSVGSLTLLHSLTFSVAARQGGHGRWMVDTVHPKRLSGDLVTVENGSIGIVVFRAGDDLPAMDSTPC